jgi:hypothetical protein
MQVARRYDSLEASKPLRQAIHRKREKLNRYEKPNKGKSTKSQFITYPDFFNHCRFTESVHDPILH